MLLKTLVLRLPGDVTYHDDREWRRERGIRSESKLSTSQIWTSRLAPKVSNLPPPTPKTSKIMPIALAVWYVLLK